MKARTVNVLAVGVGGQGIIILSDILAMVAFRAGFDVKKSEIHGISQRGGSANSHIQWGEKIFSPVIMDGEAHFIVALEESEALRHAHVLRMDGTFVVNDYRVPPATTITGQARYPANIDERLTVYGKVERISATALARDLGSRAAANVVMLGALSRHLDFPEKLWTEVLRQRVPTKFVELSLKAFAAGRVFTLSAALSPTRWN